MAAYWQERLQKQQDILYDKSLAQTQAQLAKQYQSAVKSTLTIKQLSNTGAVDALDEDNIYDVPTIEIPERFNKCEVSNDSGILYTYNNVGARETPLTLKVKNACLTAGLATAFAQWRLTEENRKRYKIHTRGNPERDISEAATVYDAFNINNNIIVTKQELIFDGGLEENLEGVY